MGTQSINKTTVRANNAKTVLVVRKQSCNEGGQLGNFSLENVQKHI